MNQPATPAPPPPDLRDLASRIARTRRDFGRVYDEVRAAVPNTRPFITVGAGLASDQVAFERALRMAEEEGWLPTLGERLVNDGFFPDASTTVTSLQALISRARGFPDATVVDRGTMRARGRLCRIEVADEHNNQAAVTGTGFLVGPSTVLTSFHVVAGLIDSGGTMKNGSESRLRVRFDYATGTTNTAEFRVPKAWLIAAKPPHNAEYDGNTTGLAHGQVDLRGHLDYAVIMVAGSPGSERGYYDLNDAVEPRAGGKIHLFQHPMSVQQRQTDGEFVGFRDPPSNERINHTANALTGSSGGLLLDGDYALVGLHQGAHGQPVVNTGISALAIRDDLEDKGAALLDARFVRAVRVEDDSRPILGRAVCQEWVRRTTKPLVRVKPFAGCKGVSFTLDIMRACLPKTDHVIGRVQAIELDSDALVSAKAILRRLGVPNDGLPTAPDADSSQGQWISDLVAAFGARVKDTHRESTVWLVFDDLHKTVIPDGSVRLFLSKLYKQSPHFENLRIVLLGMQDYPTGFPTGLVDEEDISPPQLDDIVSYVRMRMTAGGLDHSSLEVQRLAKLIHLTGGDEITGLSDYVADKVDRALNFAIEGAI